MQNTKSIVVFGKYNLRAIEAVEVETILGYTPMEIYKGHNKLRASKLKKLIKDLGGFHNYICKDP